MSEHTTYAVKDRNGNVITTITCDDPRRAFTTAMFQVRQQYAKRGITPPMFDADPEYYAEPVMPREV